MIIHRHYDIGLRVTSRVIVGRESPQSAVRMKGWTRHCGVLTSITNGCIYYFYRKERLMRIESRAWLATGLFVAAALAGTPGQLAAQKPPAAPTTAVLA